MLKAYRMQDKARAVGFDWEEKSQVWDKVVEEIGEFRTELDSMDASDPASVERAESELGDLLLRWSMRRVYMISIRTLLWR